MFKYLREHQEDTMAVMVTGKLQRADYDSLLPELEQKLQRYGKVNLYWEMKDFEGWDVSGAWQDLKLNVKHANDFRRVAMVGDKHWEQQLTSLMKPFSKAEIKFFDMSEAAEAKVWVQGKNS
ncbi:STAS/SEC14 domain-containing protein [Pedobacter sp. SYSU D00535]|uniref:STAS/SEC14 domain-containing protein n=1 Tax=Pedobacter sp. SYSU D00535 TaxID=2810308 RepID=UPI001A957A5E|nr:STAS/SEC14 domain-containing protein [Pedobacter sp. SYSU D00535]